jgi:hypothetical protein
LEGRGLLWVKDYLAASPILWLERVLLVSLIFKQDVALAVIQVQVGIVMLPLERLSILPIIELTLDLDPGYAVKVSLGRAGVECQLSDFEGRRRLILLKGNRLARLFLLAIRRQALVVHLNGPVILRGSRFSARGLHASGLLDAPFLFG